MSVARRLAAFALVLAVCFGGAYAVGAAVGTVDGAPTGTSSHSGGHGG